MTTNFALSLSFEGIDLLHRVRHGWKRVGHADVENENLDEALADLRQKALALEPGGIHTKLVIPLDQIKYIAIDSTQTNMDDILAQLDGATPYRLDELVIDCERFGGRTHIAAVARETLAEAEAFARAHGFNPVSFVAVPEPFTFQKEVFFGPTSMMQEVLGPDGAVERDTLPVMIVGTRIKSRLLVFDLHEEDLPPLDDFDLAAVLAPHVQETPEQVEETTVTAVENKPDVIETATVSAPDVQPDAVTLEPVARDPRPSFIDTIVPEFYPVVAQDPVVIAPLIETVAVPPVQAVRPVFVDAIVPEYYPVAATEPVAIDVPAEVVVLIPEHPVFAEIAMMDRIIPEIHANPIQQPTESPVILTAAAPTVAAALPTLGGTSASASRQPIAANTPRKPLMVAGVVAASIALIGAFVWSQMPDADTEDAPVTPQVAVAPPAPAPVELVEVAPTTPEVAPTIPQLVIADFAIAPDVFAAVQVPVAELPPPTLTTPEPLAVAVAADLHPLPVQPAPEPPIEETVVATAGAPVLRGRVLSPGDAAQIYAATGVWQRAPRFVDVPSETSTDGMIIPFSETVPERVVQPQMPLADDLATDLSFLAPALPPAADVEFPRDADGFILATPEGTATPEGAIVIAGAPELNLLLRPTLTDADLARMALLAPAPEGVVIIAGRPDVVPPLRPADASLPAPDEDLAEVAEQESTPQEAATPGGVALSSLQSGTTIDLVTLADPALAGARPEPRPVALASTADLGTPDITSILEGIQSEDAENAIIGATQQAVVASLRPALRPLNFDNLVAAARARQETQQAAAAAAPVRAAAPVAPQNYAPVPGGVARAATQEGVLPLREINLIGVYGRANARRALVRLSNGRYVRVEVGSALDGGQVTAIGEGALNYVKRGRTVALALPAG